MYSENGRRASRVITLLVSGLLAVLMWYIVCVSDVVEVQVELRLDYFGIPANLIITDGLVNKTIVRVRGPQTLLRSDSARYVTKSVDLSSLKPGRNTVPLLKESLRESFRAFEVVEANPRQLVIQTEPVLERVLPVVPETYTPLRRGAVEVKECKISPAVVAVRGPESIVSGMTEVTLPVRVDVQSAGHAEYKDVPLPLPQLVTARPSAVTVEYTITSSRATISRDYPVRLEAVNKEEYTLSPENLPVLVELPESLLKSPSYLRKLDVYVLPPPLEPGQSVETVVRYRPPEGMVIQSPSVRTVRVSRRPLPQQEKAQEEKAAAAKAAKEKAARQPEARPRTGENAAARPAVQER